MQDLRLIFKRDIKSFVEKDVCKFPLEDKNEFIRSYHRALGMHCINDTYCVLLSTTVSSC